MDLCRRADAVGFETWAIGTAIAKHIGGGSSDDNDKRVLGCIGQHYYQSRRYYMVKHYGWAAATTSALGELFLLGLRTIS